MRRSPLISRNMSVPDFLEQFSGVVHFSPHNAAQLIAPGESCIGSVFGHGRSLSTLFCGKDGPNLVRAINCATSPHGRKNPRPPQAWFPQGLLPK